MKLQKLMFAIVLSVFSYTVIVAQESDNSKIIENKEYTCTMHPEIISNSPEFCSKCGMKLTEKGSKIETNTKAQTYTCSMHPEVISDKASMCPKCGMNLILKEEGSNKDMGMKHHNHKGMMYVTGCAIMAGVMVVVMLFAI
ncbi:heavy metal-binding domain-containing protein [Flavobacterium sp.]|uniref:heavy metal-binding domain-containing protein n=1 Tax=Flavobacterium sp. TaxID=239 RepID=UPI003752BE08